MNYSNDTKDWIVTASDEEAVRKGCYFDIKKALRVQKFFHNFLVHPGSEHRGKPFDLLQWQWERVIAPAFGWMMPDGRRRFKEVEVWIPKKNGKSTLMAAIALYLMTCDKEYGAEIYSAASDRKQAAIIYRAAVKMVKSSVELRKSLKVRQSQKIIKFPAMESFYEVISADAHRNEGYDIHGLLFDELHTQKDRRLWGALRYGSAARRQGIRFVISTSGEHDESALWWERFNTALAVQESRTIDMHLLPCVYALRDDEDWHNHATWERVNPSYHHTLDKVEFERDHENACRNSASESEFLRYRLNKPTKAESEWVRRVFWTGCQIPQLLPQQESIDIHDADGFVVDTIKAQHCAAVDLADNVDLNAYVDVDEINHPQGGTAFQITPYFWCSEDAATNKSNPNHDRYMAWIRDDWLIAIPGPIADQERIEDDIIRILNVKKQLPTEIAIDRYNASRFCYSMQEKLQTATLSVGLRMVGYNYPTCNEAVRFIEQLIIKGRLLHDGNPVMDWMFGNCIASVDSSGNRKLDKRKSKGKIDGFAALTMAFYSIINRVAGLKSKYETMKPISIDVWSKQ